MQSEVHNEQLIALLPIEITANPSQIQQATIFTRKYANVNHNVREGGKLPKSVFLQILFPRASKLKL
jgi:hypothetical protein